MTCLSCLARRHGLVPVLVAPDPLLLALGNYTKKEIETLRRTFLILQRTEQELGESLFKLTKRDKAPKAPIKLAGPGPKSHNRQLKTERVSHKPLVTRISGLPKTDCGTGQPGQPERSPDSPNGSGQAHARPPTLKIKGGDDGGKLFAKKFHQKRREGR